MKITNETKIKMEEGKEKKKGKGGETERQTYRQTDRGRQADRRTNRQKKIDNNNLYGKNISTETD